MNLKYLYTKIKIQLKKKSFFRGVIGVLIILFILFIYFYILYQLPSPASLKGYKITPLSSHILDRNGKVLYEFYREQNRTPVKLKNLPDYVAKATIAIEDKDFYRHQGVSFIGGIARAIKDTFLKGKLQGGSTITQQLVKTSLLTPERTIRRKIKEIVLALMTEKIFTKNEILEMYLNQVSYGGAAYGIEEAAKKYFNKSAKDLTLDEAALLTGLPQAPSLYSPYNNPEAALNRRNEVLKALYKEKMISKKDYENAIAKKLNINPPKNIIKAPHFVFYIKQQLEQTYGVETVEEGGLKITTTLDLDIQEQAEKILKEELDKIKNLDVSNGAVLVTRPPTGEILAMVGSYDYFASPSGAFNVTTALRQPGSAIKPLNYAVGIERKIVTPATVFLDIPTCFNAEGQPKSYCPVNYDGKFHGPVQLRFALGNSFNIPAVKMLAYNGVENFIASASAFTITTFKDPKKYGLSLTLGGGEVRMTEMAQAFSAFANRGVARPLNGILKVEDKMGKILYQFKDYNFVKDVKKPINSPSSLAIVGSKAISPETAFIISHILLDNNARSEAFGPSSYLIVPNHAVSVKTGTTNDKRDNWTIGFTPNFLVAVWVGNNDNKPMNPWLTSGVTGAAPIWNKIISYVLKNQPDLWPIKPDTVVGKLVCWDTGGLASKNETGQENCPSRFEYFIKGTEPQPAEIIKAIIPVNKDTDKMARPNDPNIEMREKTIIKDMFSVYCIDCNHEGGDPIQIINL
ncbi:MAG: transglycosylase domain-containing protein [Microgenomates group bacterium]|nr:transglycosylase domain-containing protein [Microgenomates group bacterium]